MKNEDEKWRWKMKIKNEDEKWRWKMDKSVKVKVMQQRQGRKLIKLIFFQISPDNSLILI